MTDITIEQPDKGEGKMEESIEQLRFRLRQVEIARDQAIERTEKAEYELDVARWAVRGLVTSRARITVSVDSRLAAQSMSPETVYAFSDRAARELLHRAGLAFNEHSDQNAMRHHIIYLENHASSRGLQFTPFAHRKPGVIPSKWDRPGGAGP